MRIEEDVGRPRGRERGGRDDKLGWREKIERKKTEKHKVYLERFGNPFTFNL